MKKIFILVIFMSAAIVANAQSRVGSVSVYPRIGACISSITKDNVSATSEIDNKVNDLTVDSKFKPGFTAGVEVEYQATDNIGLTIGALYSMQGCMYPNHAWLDGNSAFASDKAYYAIDNMKTNLQYLNIPLLVNLYVYKGLALKAGVQVGFLLDEQVREDGRTMTKTKEEDGTYTYTYGESKEYKTDLKDICNKIDFAIPIGLSYEYMNVVLDARYNIGLSNIFKDETLPSNTSSKSSFDSKSKNSSFTVTLGYKFTL